MRPGRKAGFPQELLYLMGGVEPETGGVPAGLVRVAPVPAATGHLSARHLCLQSGHAGLQRRQLAAHIPQLCRQLRDAALQRRAPLTRRARRRRRARAVRYHRLPGDRLRLRLGFALLFLERLSDEAGDAVLLLEAHGCAGQTAHGPDGLTHPTTLTPRARRLALTAADNPHWHGRRPLPEAVQVTASSEPPASGRSSLSDVTAPVICQRLYRPTAALPQSVMVPAFAPAGDTHRVQRLYPARPAAPPHAWTAAPSRKQGRGSHGRVGPCERTNGGYWPVT